MGKRCIVGQSAAGKWGRAVSILKEEQTAQEIPKIVEIWDSDINNADSQLNVNKTESQKMNHIMLYSVGHKAVVKAITTSLHSRSVLGSVIVESLTKSFN